MGWAGPIRAARAWVVVSMTCIGSSELPSVGSPCISSGGASGPLLLQDGTLDLRGDLFTNPAAQSLSGSEVSATRSSLTSGSPCGVRSHLDLMWTGSLYEGDERTNSPTSMEESPERTPFGSEAW